MNEFYKEFLDAASVVFFWIGKNEAYAAEVITPWGLCFSYNIAFSHDLIDINSTSSDFNYQYFYRRRIQKLNEPPPENLPKKISTSNAGLWVGFSDMSDMMDGQSDYKFDGFVMLFHNSYELPSRRSQIIQFNPNLQAKVYINPKLNAIDESLLDYEPVE